jgi:phosphoglycolate phosphatase
LLAIALTGPQPQRKAVEIITKPNPMKPPIAVFDLDGTLVHTAADLVGSLNHALDIHGYTKADYAELAPFAGTGGRGMLKQYCQLREMSLDEPEILNVINAFLAHYEVSIPGKSIVYEGAIELVLALRDSGYKTAVCTNKPQKLADLLLGKLEISKHFDAVCGADFFAFRKPNPRHLFETIKVAGGDQSRAIMFGDSQTDFDTANAASIPVVGVDFGYSPVPITNFKITKIISHYSEMNVAIVGQIMSR